MLKHIQERLAKIKKVAGVEAALQGDGQYVFHVVVLELNQGTISARQRESNLTLSDLQSIVGIEMPVSLVITGKGIFNKKLPSQQYEQQELIHLMLPDANANDFHLQSYSNAYGTFVSLLRKNTVDKILKELEEFLLISCSIGPFGVSALKPFVEQQNSIQLTACSISFINDQIADYTIGTNLNSGCTVGGEKIDSLLLLAYAHGLQTLVPAISHCSLNLPELATAKEELVQSYIFRKAGWSVLVTFLVILLINFLLFSNLADQNKILASQKSLHQSQIIQLQQAKVSTEEKENFLRAAGWLAPSNTTMVADRIAVTVPGAVKLTSLEIHPYIENESRTKKSMIFKTGEIFIEGTCTTPTQLNPWLSSIKKLPVIDKANITSYLHDDKERYGKFTMAITLR